MLKLVIGWLLLSSVAIAEDRVAIKVPLLDSYTKELLSAHNKAMKRAKLETFPQYVTVTSAEDGRVQINHYDQLADTAFDVLNRKIVMLAYATPFEYASKKRDAVLCYTGNPTKVVDLLTTLTDSVFSNYFRVVSWKFKQEAYFALGVQSDKENFKTYPKTWHNWRGRTESILLISTETDTPDERTASVIPKCH